MKISRDIQTPGEASTHDLEPVGFDPILDGFVGLPDNALNNGIARLKYSLHKFFLSKGLAKDEIYVVGEKESYPAPEGVWGFVSPMRPIGPVSPAYGGLSVPLLNNEMLYEANLTVKGHLYERLLKASELPVFLAELERHRFPIER